MISFTITNKHRPRATVVMLVSLYGKQYKKSIGVSVPIKYWNEKKKCARTTADYNGDEVNQRIGEWEQYGNKTVKHFSDLKLSPAPEEFARVLGEMSVEAEPQVQTYFCDYLEDVYIPRYQHVRREDTVKKYHTALHKLRKYEDVRKRKLTFEGVNIDFYNDFQRWFYAQKFSANYFGNLIKIIKQVYRESRVHDKLHTLDGTEHREFTAPKQTADTVYLNADELDTIYKLPITPELVQDAENPLCEDNIRKKIAALERARGLFLIGCYTGLRVSDFSRLSDAHIGQYISIKTSKTGAAVVIPIHPVVRSIINSGFDLSNTISDQKLNGQIKELCRLAGITEKVLINKNEGGRNKELVVEKYELVTSHTARRSFATNAYKAGVPTLAIMKITGHTKESTFLKYIKVSAQENAEILSLHPFFTGATADTASAHKTDKQYNNNTTKQIPL